MITCILLFLFVYCVLAPLIGASAFGWAWVVDQYRDAFRNFFK